MIDSFSLLIGGGIARNQNDITLVPYEGAREEELSANFRIDQQGEFDGMKKQYGTKFHCYQCGCAFYDMNKPAPLCPKCNADQTKAPKVSKSSSSAVSHAREKKVERHVEEEIGSLAGYEDFDDIGADDKEDDLDSKEYSDDDED